MSQHLIRSARSDREAAAERPNTHDERTSASGGRSLAAMRGLPRVLTGLLALTALTAGCSAAATSDAPAGGAASSAAGASADHGLSRVLLLGDSVAVGQALPMADAFAASGVEFESIASEGGGNVVGPFAEEQWAELPGEIAAAEPAVVIYQITTYDWGTEEEQRTGYERLLSTVAETGADLVFVTMPPIEPDDFYRPHMSELARTADVARAVAEDSDGRAHFLDAGAVWGDTYQRTRDGRADRSTDGIHTCPQGAARFTDWLLTELAGRYPGFGPAPAEQWANTGWSADEHYNGC
ncbi:SGNH/GDSL hydrolase family protein [Allonocardiopsis opalescens]|uniref:SGNH/GDSL hydrolase family protein n=1 Tax=Allonocardiopsis opalescens TaxID=1144618 RepID=A0A2T0Q2U1_9ACTN|nr:SGNH/GDSL hydrolase family protein [Allonocardiopsis opalescens]PRX97988.1 hypothetical protein CLV72_105341 [Allonocardiopsis opalescens]